LGYGIDIGGGWRLLGAVTWEGLVEVIMQAAVSAIEYYLPRKTTSTADLSTEFPEWPAEKIDEKTGIRERHIAAPGECASDLAVAGGSRGPEVV